MRTKKPESSFIVHPPRYFHRFYPGKPWVPWINNKKPNHSSTYRYYTPENYHDNGKFQAFETMYLLLKDDEKLGYSPLPSYSSWWLNQPIWNIFVKTGSSSPRFGVKINNIFELPPPITGIWRPKVVIAYTPGSCLSSRRSMKTIGYFYFPLPSYFSWGFQKLP